MRKYNLFDISQPKQWKTISSEELIEDGKYPVYGANGIIGYYDKYNHEKETVLITCRGATCGEVNLSKPFSYINGNAMALDEVDETLVSTKYLFYYFKQYNFQGVISGSAQPQITRAGLKNVIVPIPDLENQNEIVAILDKASALVQKRQDTIDLLDELLRAQFLEMFGDPVINPKKLPLTPFKNIVDKIDAGWSPVCEETSRSSDDQWAVLKQGAVSKRTFIATENKTLPIGTAIKKEVTANKGDLLFSRKNTKEYVGSAVYIFEDYQKLLLPDTIFNIRYNKDRVSPVYLFYLLNDKNFRIVVQNLRNGAAASMPNISQQKLLELLIPLPELIQQNQFESFVLKLYGNKKVIEDSLYDLTSLFQSILQRAFSGKLKLDASTELDALLKEINLKEPKNDIISIASNEEYVLNLIKRLNNQEFDTQDLYDKAQHAAFQLMKEKRVTQEYNEYTKSLKLAVK